jgi:hypothetical protein
MGTPDWMAIANACPIPMEALPTSGTSDEQAQFLPDYLAGVRESKDYDCYTCVERVLAMLEEAAASPVMEA